MKSLYDILPISFIPRWNSTNRYNDPNDTSEGTLDNTPPSISYEEREELPTPYVLNTTTTPQISYPLPRQMPCPDTIKHLVISGGAELGFSFYSALRESNKAGFWKIEDIETIYSTSVGSIFAISTSLLPHLSWDIYDDFVLKRPWHHVFDFKLKHFANSFHKKGMFAKETIHDIFRPIFNAVDLPMNITMKQFFEYTHIELHIMATELTQFQLVDFSHITHPDWELMDVVYCSAGLPLLFAPHCVDDCVYLDGGMISNYPINHSINRAENPNEILGFRRQFQKSTSSIKLNTLFDYLYFIMYTMFSKVSETPQAVKNQVEVVVSSPTVNFYSMYNAFKSYDERVILMDNGCKSWISFYEKTYPDNLRANNEGAK
jgi:predicted acylesterase/phospholipase RssA